MPKQSRRNKIHLPKLLKKQRRICAICGTYIYTYASKRYYPTVDHVVPISKGGSNKIENKTAVHYKCNNYKGNKTYEELFQNSKFLRYYDNRIKDFLKKEAALVVS